MKYDYYGLKSKIDDFLDLHDEEIVKQGWTITSKPCDDCKDFDIKLRYSDPKYCYETTTGSKSYNLDYLFVEKIDKNKQNKTVYSSAKKFGFVITENGLITDLLNIKLV
jgi:hypothetical protein